MLGFSILFTLERNEISVRHSTFLIFVYIYDRREKMFNAIIPNTIKNDLKIGSFPILTNYNCDGI